MDYIYEGIVAIIVALIAWLSGRSKGSADVNRLNAETIISLSKRISDLESERTKHKEKINELEDQANYVLGRLDVFERAWLEVKQWFVDFKGWVDERGYTGYPTIPRSVTPTETRKSSHENPKK